MDDDLSGSEQRDGPEPAGEAHARMAQRESMFLIASVSGPGAPDAQLRVRNLSAGGMMAESERLFAIGDSLTVDLRGVGAVTGTVAWVRAPRMGIKFDRTIDPKLTRKVPAQSPGTKILLIPAAQSAKRPRLRIG
jgi:hypothetical protein